VKLERELAAGSHRPAASLDHATARGEPNQSRALSSMQEIVDGFDKQVGLVHKRHVPRLRQDYQLRSGDLFVHRPRE
jgi:hypothetical protein